MSAEAETRKPTDRWSPVERARPGAVPTRR